MDTKTLHPTNSLGSFSSFSLGCLEVCCHVGISHSSNSSLSGSALVCLQVGPVLCYLSACVLSLTAVVALLFVYVKIFLNLAHLDDLFPKNSAEVLPDIFRQVRQMTKAALINYYSWNKNTWKPLSSFFYCTPAYSQQFLSPPGFQRIQKGNIITFIPALPLPKIKVSALNYRQPVREAFP